MVFQQILMPAVAGQLPYIGKALLRVVEWFPKQGRQRIVRSPEKTADVLNPGFPKQPQGLRLTFERIIETASGPLSDAGPLEDMFDGLLSCEDFLAPFFEGNSRAAEIVVTQHLMCVGVCGNLEQRMIQESAIFGGIGVERLAQDEECRRHLKSLMYLHDFAACLETARRFRVIGCDVTRLLLPGLPDLGHAGRDSRPDSA